MLQSYSWQTFLTIIITLAIAYYLIIILVYYRKDITNVLSGKRRPGKNNQKAKTAQPDLFPGKETTPSSEDPKSEEVLFSLAHTLGGKLKQIIQEAAIKKTVKEELLMAIQIVLRKDIYQSMKGTAFSIAINNLIVYECETQCSVHLSALEVNALWIK